MRVGGAEGQYRRDAGYSRYHFFARHQGARGRSAVAAVAARIGADRLAPGILLGSVTVARVLDTLLRPILAATLVLLGGTGHLNRARWLWLPGSHPPE
jgi:hypothetical protein